MQQNMNVFMKFELNFHRVSIDKYMEKMTPFLLSRNFHQIFQREETFDYRHLSKRTEIRILNKCMHIYIHCSVAHNSQKSRNKLKCPWMTK